MKTVLTKFIALSSLSLLMLSACKKDGALVTSNGGKPGALTASTMAPVLDKTKLSDTTKIVNFSFTAPDYGYSAAVTNTLQIDSAGDNWKKPTSVTLSTKVLSQGYSTSDFNALLLKLNLAAGVASKVNVRVAHSLSATVAPVYSNVLTLTVTPFNLTSYVYVVGQFNGYSTSSPDSLVSVTGNGIYTGVINFPTGSNRFLVLPAKNYANKYATTASPNTSATSLTYATEYVTGGGSDLYAPAAGGQYLITLNTNTNVISVVPANSYSVIGDAALGWNAGNDVAMKYVNDGNSSWVVKLPLSSTGAFKIRQNDDWAFSWGIPQASTEGAGVANTLNDTKNNNITVATSGTYTVTFTIPLTAVGTTPAVTANYTVK